MGSRLAFFSKFAATILVASVLGCGGNNGGGSDSASFTPFNVYYVDSNANQTAGTVRSYETGGATPTDLASLTNSFGYTNVSHHAGTGTTFVSTLEEWGSVRNVIVRFDNTGTRVSTGFGFDLAEISPDGTQIATYLAEDTDFVFMDINGGNQIPYNISSHPDRVAWHPNGTKALVSAGGFLRVYEVGNPTSTDITMPANTYSSHACYNQDGTKILLMHDSATSSKVPTNSTYGFWIMNADGTGLTFLKHIENATRISFDPEGTGVVYTDGANVYRYDIATEATETLVTGSAKAVVFGL